MSLKRIFFEQCSEAEANGAIRVRNAAIKTAEITTKNIPFDEFLKQTGVSYE